MNLKKKAKEALVVFATLILTCSTAWATDKCPSAQSVRNGIKNVFNRDFDVKNVVPSVVPGICEAHVMVEGSYNILYIDSSGKYFFAGNLIEISSNKNLTQEALQSLNKLTASDVNKLRNLVAFTIGKKGPEFFFVTDPQCPYCKKGLPAIKKLANEGKLRAHVLLFPLSFHREAKEQCISIICDKKGVEGLESQYKSANQCESGKKKIEETVAFLKAKGIQGTPSYIFTNGEMHVGLIATEEELMEILLKSTK